MIDGENLYLERRDASRNMARFYAFSVEQDLFGALFAVRRWGRIGTRGRTVSLPCPDMKSARAALETVAVVKRRRGYIEPEATGSRR